MGLPVHWGHKRSTRGDQRMAGGRQKTSGTMWIEGRYLGGERHFERLSGEQEEALSVEEVLNAEEGWGTAYWEDPWIEVLILLHGLQGEGSG